METKQKTAPQDLKFTLSNDCWYVKRGRQQSRITNFDLKILNIIERPNAPRFERHYKCEIVFWQMGNRDVDIDTFSEYELLEKEQAKQAFWEIDVLQIMNVTPEEWRQFIFELQCRQQPPIERKYPES